MQLKQQPPPPHLSQRKSSHGFSKTACKTDVKVLPSSCQRLSSEARAAFDETRLDTMLVNNATTVGQQRSVIRLPVVTGAKRSAALNGKSAEESRPQRKSSETVRQSAPVAGTQPLLLSLPPLRRTSQAVSMIPQHSEYLQTHRHHVTPPHVTPAVAPPPEKTFVITAPGYDCRFADALRRAELRDEAQRSKVTATQNSIYADAVAKCTEWMNKYLAD